MGRIVSVMPRPILIFSANTACHKKVPRLKNPQEKKKEKRKKA